MIKRDFTISIYRELLESIPKGNYTLQGYLENNSQKGIIRHDVDRPPANVHQLAKLESDLGIFVTYFFRVKKKHFNTDIISKVRQLGHEIGYHYEVMDKAKGDVRKAKDIFRNEWVLFKEWGSKTVCMHGNPFSKYDNKAFWQHYDFSEFNVLGEGYLSVDFSKYNYFTDTGRKWNYENLSIKDKPKGTHPRIKSTFELIEKIQKKEIRNFYILTHPSRWNNNLASWSEELIAQSIKNIVKSLITSFKVNRE